MDRAGHIKAMRFLTCTLCAALVATLFALGWIISGLFQSAQDPVELRNSAELVLRAEPPR